MPTYEYVCTACGNPLEVVQSIHEPSLSECPSCQGRLRKVFGNVGVVFKGSGFYRTDNRGPSASKAASAPSPTAGSAEPGSSPAAKPTETPSTGTASKPAAASAATTTAAAS